MSESDVSGRIRAIRQNLVLRALRSIRRVRGEAAALRAGIRFGLVGRLARRLHPSANPALQQAFLEHPTKIGAVAAYSDLLAWLRERGVRTLEGAWTIYVPPQESLREVLGDFVAHYPADAGFKILKDLGPAEIARYVPRDRKEWDRNPDGGIGHSLAVGDSNEQVARANVLYEQGIGSRLYDMATLRTASGALTAMVVQHVEGQEPSVPECESLLAKIDELLEEGVLGLPYENWRHHKDFTPPGCNGNAIRSDVDQRVLYVDTQAFLVPPREKLVARALGSDALRDLHFGEERFVRGGRYLYQSVPDVDAVGKRDTDRRWKVLTELMRETDVQLRGAAVFDVGCNAGIMLANALAAGAAWGVGWDRPEVVSHAGPLLRALGFTRFDLTSANLVSDYPLLADVPAHVQALERDGVIFYLAMRKHIGFLENLPTLPWRTMVYEGNEMESAETLPEFLEGLRALCDVSILRVVDYQDGDGNPRPLAILRRED